MTGLPCSDDEEAFALLRETELRKILNLPSDVVASFVDIID